MTLFPMPTHSRRYRAPLVGAGALLAIAALSACSGADDQTSADATPTGSPACPLTVTDPWLKAADSGMSAAFATLSNAGTTAVQITAASSQSTSATELHEVVTKDGAMVMQPVGDGFTVPAGGALTLEPGGYHLMLMDITTPIEAGDTVAFTLTCGSAGTVTFDATAKAYDGGNETYHGDPSSSASPASKHSTTPGS